MTDNSRDVSNGGASSSVSGGAGDVVQARDVHGNIYFQYGPGSRESVPRQLPRGIRAFINRARDLAGLDELLDSGQCGDEIPVVYAISGTAGVGKTSLVLYWANRVRNQFPDGQLYVDLRGYDPGLPLTPDQVLEQFLLALGVPAASIPDDLGAKSGIYRSVLADKKMLVILDNAGTADQVRPLLPGAGRSLTIVTSRSRLASLAIRDGVQRAMLDTLSEAEAVNLLIATMSNYRRGDDPADIAELAALCAYLPLALRIAGERAVGRPGMPLPELIADLRDRSSLWDTLSVDDESDVSAIRAVFAWSYRALPKNAARLFCFLGLHPGSVFSQEAAVALSGGTSREVRNSLGSLEGACLLEPRGYKRYQVHDLLRVYAIDQARYEIAQDDQMDALSRICEWYLRSSYNCVLSLAHDATLLFDLPPSEMEAMAFADRDQAAKWYTEEKLNLVGAVRAAYEAGLFVLAWQLGAVLERIFSSYNHFQDWRTTSELALVSARQLGRRADQAVMHESLGRLSRLLMQLDAAASHYEEALRIYREENDLLASVKALNGLAWVYLFAHRIEDSRAALADALAIVRGVGDGYWTATILFGMGYTYLQLRLLDQAEDCLAESLRFFRSVDDRLYESMLLTFHSYLARERRDVAGALAMAQEALDISRDLDNRLWEATALLYLGKAQLAAGRAGDALESYQRSEVLSRQESDLSRSAMALAGVGRAYGLLGRPADAAEFYRLAMAVFRQLGDRWKLARTLDRIAEVMPDAPDETVRSRRAAIDILADFPDPRSRALRARLLAAVQGFA